MQNEFTITNYCTALQACNAPWKNLVYDLTCLHCNAPIVHCHLYRHALPCCEWKRQIALRWVCYYFSYENCNAQKFIVVWVWVINKLRRVHKHSYYTEFRYKFNCAAFALQFFHKGTAAMPNAVEQTHNYNIDKLYAKSIGKLQTDQTKCPTSIHENTSTCYLVVLHYKHYITK